MAVNVTYPILRNLVKGITFVTSLGSPICLLEWMENRLPIVLIGHMMWFCQEMREIWTFEVRPKNQDSNIAAKEKSARRKLFYFKSAMSLIIGNFKLKAPIKGGKIHHLKSS